jgi:hypothetical protein
MVLFACCLEDWTDKYANLDRADNICANIRRHNAVGNEEIDDILADLRMDIDTTRRLFDKEFAKVADDSDDVADTDLEVETEEESDADERFAKAREGKSKDVAAASSTPLRAVKVILDKAVWELLKVDRAELEALKVQMAELESTKANKSKLDALKAELAELWSLVQQRQHVKQEPIVKAHAGANIKTGPGDSETSKLEVSLRPKSPVSPRCRLLLDGPWLTSLIQAEAKYVPPHRRVLSPLKDDFPPSPKRNSKCRASFSFNNLRKISRRFKTLLLACT